MTNSNIPSEYKCKQCERVLPLDSTHFHKSPTGIGGFKSKCKKCCKDNADRYKREHPNEVRAQKKRYHDADPERYRQQAKKSYDTHREERNAKSRKYRAENRDTLLPRRRELYQINIERHHAHQRRRYYAHPDREVTRERRRLKELGLKFCTGCKEWWPSTTKYFHSDYRPNRPNKTPLASKCKVCANSHRKIDPWEKRHRKQSNEIKYRWKTRHPQKQKLISARWRKNNKDRRRAQLHNYRAMKNSNGGTHTAEDIQRIYKYQKGRCYYCYKRVKNNYHVDHVVPIKRKGRNDPSNLVIACPPCNQSKGAKLPHEWPQGGKLL